ncbi:Lrp/AsnC family transcriptional regulator [Streptosporangium lutulentum]
MRPKVFPTFPRWGRTCGSIFYVDAIDRKILAVLQEDGRLTITELAARVGLSVSPCHRRCGSWSAAGRSAATGRSSTRAPSA